MIRITNVKFFFKEISLLLRKQIVHYKTGKASRAKCPERENRRLSYYRKINIQNLRKLQSFCMGVPSKISTMSETCSLSGVKLRLHAHSFLRISSILFLSSPFSSGSHFCKKERPYNRTSVEHLGIFFSIAILFLVLRIAQVKPAKIFCVC